MIEKREKTPDWVTVEVSPLILSGRLSLGRQSAPVHQFVALHLGDTDVVKGGIEKKDYSIPYFIADESDLDEVKADIGKHVVLFAMPCTNGRGEICLVDEARLSVFAYSDSLLGKIAKIHRENDSFYQQGVRYGCDEELRRTQHVNQLVDQLDNSDADQQRAVLELLKLGPLAVPSLICLMPNEHIRFRLKTLVIPNDKNAFEQHAMYSPAFKVDAIDAILSAMTGVQFLPLANGASDEDRARSIRGWMIYLQRSQSKPIQ